MVTKTKLQRWKEVCNGHKTIDFGLLCANVMRDACHALH